MNKKNNKNKVDMEAKLSMFILNLKEEKNKQYSHEECAINITYLFENYDEFKKYFLENGLVDVSDDFLNICIMKTTRKGTIIALKKLCDYAIREYKFEKSNTVSSKEDDSDKLEEDNDVQISLFGVNGFYKLIVSDSVTISSQKIDNIISSNMEFKTIYDELPARIFVDDFKINKGVYYFIILEGKKYIIFIDNGFLRINEFIEQGDDLECNKKNIVVERVLKYNEETNLYDFIIFKHDEFKSTYYHMLYSNYCEYLMPEFKLSKKDAFREINDLFSNLEKINCINDIIDINFFREIFKNDTFIKSKNIDN